jgi:hypothetical protein
VSYFYYCTFNEQLTILQRTATTALILYRGVPKAECNHLIASDMPPFGGPLD